MTRILELKTNITNPTADRRSKDWNKAPVLRAGNRFTFHDGKDFDYLYSADHHYNSEPAHSELGKLILGNSVEVEPKTIRELARFYDMDFSGATAEVILEHLIKLGRVGKADFEAVAKAITEEESV